MAYDRQSQSQPPVSAGAYRIGLLEAVEDEGEEVRPDASSGVAYLDFDVSFDLPQSDPDLATLRRKLDCVGEKVPHHLLQAVRISRRFVGEPVPIGEQRDPPGIPGPSHRGHP